MGSNKRHKSDKSRETKKKRHRSKSRSYSPDRERTDKHRHHKKHRKRDRKDYDSDVEIVNAPPPPKISRTLYVSSPPPPPEISTSSKDDRYFNQSREDRPSKQKRSPSPPRSGQSQASLSIEETNRLRAKLGLKPLEVDTGPKEGSDLIKDDLGEFHHKPASNIAEKEKSQKIKEKISTMKQKRQFESALASIRTLGDSDSDEDALAWVSKSRKIEEEKRKAVQREKELKEMEEAFDVDNLVREEVRNERLNAYTGRDLRGLKVEHNLNNFMEGNAIILTLKDQDVLAEDGDVLVNVNMVDDERYKKNILVKSKKPGYDAYDESNFDEAGMSLNHVLKKYDEEIEGEKRESFAIGMVDPKEIIKREAADIKKRLANKRLESLELPELKIASDYYNEDELTKFKKVKRRMKKIRTKKTLRADDLIVPDSKDYLRDLGSRRRRRNDRRIDEPSDVLETDDIEVPIEDQSGVKIEPMENNMDRRLKRAAEARAKGLKSEWLKPENIAVAIKQEEMEDDETNASGTIALDSTAEFCRTLGDIPTYGQAGNREENNREFMDFEMDKVKNEYMEDEDDMNGRGAWNSVEMEQISMEPAAMEAAILDAEPSLDQGVGGALRLAMSKGYLQKEDSNRPSASRFAHLKAQNYSIEDKTYGDDDKFGRRDRFNGPTSEFKEKEGFRPNVKLEYIDDDGHVLNAKEAFRYLSHKFHGKGPGKNKVEKRMKKADQEILMKRMSSTDTPLGTLTLLQAKQKETQSPFIVLSGSKQMQTASISKSKN